MRAAGQGGPECWQLNGLAGSERALVVARFFIQSQQPLVVVTSTPAASQQFAEDLAFFAAPRKLPVAVLPPPEALAGRLEDMPGNALRLRALYSLAASQAPSIAVTSVAGLLPRLMPRAILHKYSEWLVVGEEFPRDRLVEQLLACGYTATPLVEQPGDFCLRGGILDVFSPLYDDPLRLEYFGDELEKLRFFSAATQRTQQPVSEAEIIPVREVILPNSALPQLVTALQDLAARRNLSSDSVLALTERLQQEGFFKGFEAFGPLIYDHLESLPDYMPASTVFVLLEPGELQKQAEALLDQAWHTCRQHQAQGQLSLEPSAGFLDWRELEARLQQHPVLTVRHLAVEGGPGAEPDPTLTGPPDPGQPDPRPLPKPLVHRCCFEITSNRDLHDQLMQQQDRETLLTPLTDWLRQQQREGFFTLLLCRTRSQIERLELLLRPYGIQMEPYQPEAPGGLAFDSHRRVRGRLSIGQGHLSSGFVWEAEKLALITEDEIFGQKRRRPRHKPVPKTERLTFGDLQLGDLVVHREHGIGQYQGLMKLRVDGTTDDYLEIVYRGGDKLYLPVVRLNLIQKYLGVDDQPPTLDRMGGKTWARTRERVKQSVEKIAGELLKLYAARKTAPGVAYSYEDTYLRDFEASFAWEETPDQLRAINEVLADMATPVPMDRLICGDVGYGKTEVALRAAFVAVNFGKQVAVVVPTTVLAEQHFATFRERLKRYPIEVACLSRFRTRKEQNVLLERLQKGQVDIVIGTHRLLQKDVTFKDLGLVVLDEEHRFGVVHKEKLKQLRANVDVLALTATPIPRTLHMSMTGIRDMSIIATPPEERRSIITYICEYEPAIIASAIRQELQRQGQIFFVHNTIHTIEAQAARLKALVPEVRLDVAHARLSENALEKVMWRFMQHELDLLVCTTIIESGLDIPAANTIIINRADRFGLAQMYQLRGRVGRSGEQAYAYLIIPRESSLGRDAQKRLKVLMEHSDLGAGFQIAMNDLKIRGGGTILGASQSGHIAAVGYDMFLELMEEAIADLKGETRRETLEPEIHIPLNAYLPEDYIDDLDQRLLVYRRLAQTSRLNELADLKNELVDRFGALPPEASNLMLKMMLKILATAAAIKRLDLTEPYLFMTFSEAHLKNPLGLAHLLAQTDGRYTLTPEGVLKTELRRRRNPNSLLLEAKGILKEVEGIIMSNHEK